MSAPADMAAEYDQPAVLELLRAAWAKHPDLQLGEIVHVAALRSGALDAWDAGAISRGLAAMAACPAPADVSLTDWARAAAREDA